MPRVCRISRHFGDDRFAVALGLSLLLHAVLAAWPNLGKLALQPASSDKLPPIRSMHVSLTHVADARELSLTVSPRPISQGSAATPAAAGKPRQPPPSRFQAPSNVVLEATAPATPGVPRFDLDELKAQARQLPLHNPKDFADSGSRPGKAEPATPDILDRPALQTLAKRLGQRPDVVSEQTLSDGSRRVRFSGNVCLHIPRYLPLGRESEFGPTILVPTNCPD